MNEENIKSFDIDIVSSHKFEIELNLCWISVKEKLPEDKISFLGTDGETIFVAEWNDDLEEYVVGSRTECYYCGGKSRVSFKDEKSWHDCKKITHWMPLPELPKEKS